MPWTALVPFADCLNHANKQTKYDYDEDNNGTFRLFPTGDNKYGVHEEVFNSYGRRPNSKVLLDYGFAMQCNEWDTVELILEIIPTYAGYSEKLRILMHVGGKAKYQSMIVSVFDFPLDALEYCRILALTDEDMEHYWTTQHEKSKVQSQEVHKHFCRRRCSSCL